MRSSTFTGGVLSLKQPKVSEKEATVFHIKERVIMAACDRRRPAED